MKPDISFFCPAYNDEKNVVSVVSRAERLLKKVAKKYEIIVVEDGSPDNTYAVLQKLKKKVPSLRIIRHPKNLGYGAALKDGFLAAKFDLVMYTDGDYQYDPLEFEKLLKHIGTYDVVIGYKIKRNESAYRSFQSYIFNVTVRVLFGLSFKDINCSMKIIPRYVLDKMEITTDTAFIDAEILCMAKKLGCKVKEVPVHHYPRKHGKPGGVKLSVILPTIVEMFRFFFRQLRL